MHSPTLCACVCINSHFTEETEWNFILTVSPQKSTRSLASYVCVTHADTKSFVICICEVIFHLDRWDRDNHLEITPNKPLARDFQTIQSPTAAKERTLPEKTWLGADKAPSVCL